MQHRKAEASNAARWVVVGVILTSVIVLGRWWIVRVSHAESHPADSGRLVGDLTTDASRYPSLQAAIDAIPPGGGVVSLPAGLFEIHEPLVISQSDVCLQGTGTASRIHNANSSGEPAVLIQHASRQDDAEAMLWRIRLANLRITGNPKSGHGIEARRVNELFLDGLTISEHGGDGVRGYVLYEDPRVCDSLITYNKHVGLNLEKCHDIIVSANQFEENGTAVRCVDGYNLTMTGNNLDDHLVDGVVIENTHSSVLSGNMIEQCAGSGVVLDRDCYAFTLSCNVLALNSVGIDLRDAHGSSVTGNTFTINRLAALHIGPHSGRIAVTGNSFCDSYIGDGKLRHSHQKCPAGGIILENTAEIAISGNVFSGLRPKAILLEGEASEHVVFTGNVIVLTNRRQFQALLDRCRFPLP